MSTEPSNTAPAPEKELPVRTYVASFGGAVFHVEARNQRQVRSFVAGLIQPTIEVRLAEYADGVDAAHHELPLHSAIREREAGADQWTEAQLAEARSRHEADGSPTFTLAGVIPVDPGVAYVTSGDPRVPGNAVRIDGLEAAVPLD